MRTVPFKKPNQFPRLFLASILALVETPCNNHVHKAEWTSVFSTFLHLLPPPPTLSFSPGCCLLSKIPRCFHTGFSTFFLFLIFFPFKSKDCFIETPEIGGAWPRRQAEETAPSARRYWKMTSVLGQPAASHPHIKHIDSPRSLQPGIPTAWQMPYLGFPTLRQTSNPCLRFPVR